MNVFGIFVVCLIVWLLLPGKLATSVALWWRITQTHIFTSLYMSVLHLWFVWLYDYFFRKNWPHLVPWWLHISRYFVYQCTWPWVSLYVCGMFACVTSFVRECDHNHPNITLMTCYTYTKTLLISVSLYNTVALEILKVSIWNLVFVLNVCLCDVCFFVFCNSSKTPWRPATLAMDLLTVRDAPFWNVLPKWL